jgi:hypothetical protein
VKIIITLTEEMLGTKALPADVFEEYIGEGCPDSTLIKKEVENAKNTEAEVRAASDGQPPVTVFHRNAAGDLIIYDYQVKGFLKEAGDILRQCEKDEPDPDTGKKKRRKWASAKKKIDNFVFVSPREIVLGVPKGLQAICERPLRAMTMQGERVSIARSETIPARTQFAVEITLLPGGPVTEEMICHALDYGRFKGLGQWRNSGKGRFTWGKDMTPGD